MSCREGLEFGTTVDERHRAAARPGRRHARHRGRRARAARPDPRRRVGRRSTRSPGPPGSGSSWSSGTCPIPQAVARRLQPARARPAPGRQRGQAARLRAGRGRADEVLAAMRGPPVRSRRLPDRHLRGRAPAAWSSPGPGSAAPGWSTCRSASSCRGSAEGERRRGAAVRALRLPAQRARLLRARPAPRRCSCPGVGCRDRAGGPGGSRAPGATWSSSPRRPGSRTRWTSRWSRPTGSATTCSTRCDPGALRGPHAATAFRGQLGGTWRDGRGRALAHHSFQVFEVYPWAALLHPAATGRARGVRARPLPDPDRRGARRRRRVRDRDVAPAALGRRGALRAGEPGARAGALVGRRPEPASTGPAAGDRVALHWDWVCETITPDQGRWIEGAERRQLAVLGLAGSTGRVRGRFAPRHTGRTGGNVACQRQNRVGSGSGTLGKARSGRPNPRAGAARTRCRRPAGAASGPRCR